MAEPMYRRIAEDLRKKIQSGELEPGSQLPTELELRDHYDNASRNTVRDALKWLVTRGLVVTQPGRGTFVADRIVPIAVTLSTDSETGLGGGEGMAYEVEIRAQRRKPDFTSPRVEIQKAGETSAAGPLQLDETASVVSRHQKLSIDDKPWAMQTSFYPFKLIEQGAARLVEAGDIKPGAVTYLRKTLGLKQVGYQDRITARPPNRGEIEFFNLRDVAGAAVIETIRTAYDEAGMPFRCTVTVWPVDRNSLVYNFGTLPKEITAPDYSNGGDSPDAD